MSENEYTDADGVTYVAALRDSPSCDGCAHNNPVSIMPTRACSRSPECQGVKRADKQDISWVVKK